MATPDYCLHSFTGIEAGRRTPNFKTQPHGEACAIKFIRLMVVTTSSLMHIQLVKTAIGQCNDQLPAG
jgi:hypothetical protein